ncbi:hypothetical protein NPIL_504051, partial [Nephila pilipes]
FLDETITHEKKLKKTMAYADLESSLEQLLTISDSHGIVSQLQYSQLMKKVHCVLASPYIGGLSLL